MPFSPSASSSRTVSPIDPGLVVLKLFLHQWTPSAHFRREVRFPHTCLLVVVVEHVFARPFSQVENTFIVTSSSPSASSSCSSPSSSPSSPSTPASFSYTPRFSSPSCVRYLGVLTNAALTFADHHSNPSPETLAAIKSLRASAQNALFLYQSPASVCVDAIVMEWCVRGDWFRFIMKHYIKLRYNERYLRKTVFPYGIFCLLSLLHSAFESLCT